MCVWEPLKSEGIDSLGPRVRDGCEPLCESWEPNQDPLQEQMLLTAEPFPTL